jgi:hypothetical protein
VYFYVESDLAAHEEAQLLNLAKTMGITVVIRGPRYIRSALHELRDPEALASE